MTLEQFGLCCVWAAIGIIAIGGFCSWLNECDKEYKARMARKSQEVKEPDEPIDLGESNQKKKKDDDEELRRRQFIYFHICNK